MKDEREDRDRKELFRENFQNGQRRKSLDHEKRIKLPQKGRSGNKNWARYLEDEDGDEYGN